MCHRRTMLAAFRSPLRPVARPISRPHRALRLRRLCGIRAEQTVLKRRPIETADYGVHLLGIRRFNERETLGLLCFRIADNLDRVCDQVFGCQPALNIVRGDPNGQVAQKDRKTHSAVVFNSIGGGLPRVQYSLGHYQRITSRKNGQNIFKRILRLASGNAFVTSSCLDRRQISPVGYCCCWPPPPEALIGFFLWPQVGGSGSLVSRVTGLSFNIRRAS